MEKNKTGKYFKYAIGEIVLVVIGILIALSINNWNENKKSEFNELKLLKQIEQDLVENRKEYNNLKMFNNSMLKAGEFVLNHIKDDLPLTDSLLYHFQFTKYQIDFNPIKTSYVFMLNSGLNELKNDSLRIALTKFYEQDISLVSLRNDKLLAIQINHLDPFMIKNFKEENIEFENSSYFNNSMTVPRDYLKLTSNETYANIIRLKNDRLGLNLTRLSQCENNLEKLIKLFRNEIGKIEAN
jgi:hypothetical protein